jgi:hypothetical protein
METWKAELQSGMKEKVYSLKDPAVIPLKKQSAIFKAMSVVKL